MKKRGVKDFIERKMEKIVIIKLLGRKIAFNALLNRITILWKINSPFKLMDLENDYYLVWFSEEDGYNKVLTNRPWMIFGQYLMIRPWTSNFSTTQDEVGIQVVWVWLLGLSK
ncbi:hypothetical protein J1N35_011690, partial [Gossypium stocksii]